MTGAGSNPPSWRLPRCRPSIEGVQILDREIPPEIEALYEEVVALRPQAGLKFQRFLPPQGLAIVAMHSGDYAGDSEIRLTPDYDLPSLVHVLLHALLYRKGYPVASALAASDVTYASIAAAAGCCASHGLMTVEVGKRPDIAAYWRQEVAKFPDAADIESDEPLSILDCWRLADAVAQAAEGAEAAADLCRERRQESWAVVERFLQARERCLEPAGLRWYRAMAGLVRFFDAIVAAENGRALPPSDTVMVSLVVSEPQLQRAADRLIEIVPLARDVVGFRQKQEGVLFHVRFALPGKQKRELAEVRADLKLRTEDFLNKYWVPYTVDLRAAAAR